jgi:hypothetical protein
MPGTGLLHVLLQLGLALAGCLAIFGTIDAADKALADAKRLRRRDRGRWPFLSPRVALRMAATATIFAALAIVSFS